MNECGGNVHIKTQGLGLIALGILLLGAQLVLFLGLRNVHPSSRGESHIEPLQRITPLRGIFGGVLP